jgi:hypothetical protein
MKKKIITLIDSQQKHSVCLYVLPTSMVQIFLEILEDIVQRSKLNFI